MGQQVSKDIRSRLEHQTVEELLINDKYIEELAQYLPRLPTASHHNLTKILASWEKGQSGHSIRRSESNHPPKDGNSRSYKLRSLWSIQSQDINIPQNAAEVLKQDPRNLLRQSLKNGVDLQSPSDYYEYTCNVETDRILCKFLWRFLTTFYYDLISELDATRNLLSKTENGGIAFVVSVICQSGKHNHDIVRQRVIGWAKIGRRYRGFMNTLCSGCLFLFPDKISDLVWEQYVPVKGGTFTKVTSFLRELGIVRKCEEEGWNDLSDQILLILREPFQRIIPFQYHPHQPRLACGSGPLATAPGGDEIHIQEDSILARGRIQDLQVVGVDRSFSCSALDSTALSRPSINRVTKTKRKPNIASSRRFLTKNITPHQTPRSDNSPPWLVHERHHAAACHSPDSQHGSRGPDLQTLSPRSSIQCWAPAPNDDGHWHIPTSSMSGRLPSSSVSINDRDSLSDISLNASPGGTDSAQYRPNVTPGCNQRLLSPPRQHVDSHLYRGHREESISHALRPERTGVGTISAVLNHDSNIPAPAVAITQRLLEGSGSQQCHATHSGVGRNLLPAIRIDKITVHQIVVERPHDIRGGIWFGSPQGYPPCVLLRLPKALDTYVKPSGQEVYIPGPSATASTSVTRIYLIKLECFVQMIDRDGFGMIYWNECGEDAFVTMEVKDEGLVEDFISGAVPEPE